MTAAECFGWTLATALCPAESCKELKVLSGVCQARPRPLSVNLLKEAKVRPEAPLIGSLRFTTLLPETLIGREGEKNSTAVLTIDSE